MATKAFGLTEREQTIVTAALKRHADAIVDLNGDPSEVSDLLAALHNLGMASYVGPKESRPAGRITMWDERDGTMTLYPER